MQTARESPPSDRDSYGSVEKQGLWCSRRRRLEYETECVWLLRLESARQNGVCILVVLMKCQPSNSLDRVTISNKARNWGPLSVEQTTFLGPDHLWSDLPGLWHMRNRSCHFSRMSHKRVHRDRLTRTILRRIRPTDSNLSNRDHYFRLLLESPFPVRLCSADHRPDCPATGITVRPQTQTLTQQSPSTCPQRPALSRLQSRHRLRQQARPCLLGPK